MAEYKVISELVYKKTNKRVKVGETLELNEKQAKQALKAGVVEEVENTDGDQIKGEETPNENHDKETKKDKSTKNKG